MKAQVMKIAWKLYSNRQWRSGMQTFAECLQESWARAKAEKARAEAMASNPEIKARIDHISYVINFSLNGKGGRCTSADVNHANTLIAEKNRLERLVSA